MSEARPRYQFYGRRKGHALRSHHVRLVETLLPKLRIDLREISLLSSGVARSGPFSHASRHGRRGNQPGTRPAAETWLEIGFGGGEHLAHQAALHRDIQFFGAEPFLNGVAKLLALIEEKQLANIRIFDGDARYLLEALPDASVDRIYLLYPDPWPKLRHHKRRFVNPDNLRHIHRVLKPHGLFVFASDMQDYVDWTRAHVSAQGGFLLHKRDSNRSPEGWIETRYEAKARADGRKAVYLEYKCLKD